MRLNPLGDGTPEVSPFQSIPASFWWCIVTLTTVGYGDETPYSGVGKFIAAVASLTGILVVAIPVSVISTNFNAEFLKLQRQRDQVRARMGLLHRAPSATARCATPPSSTSAPLPKWRRALPS